MSERVHHCFDGGECFHSQWNKILACRGDCSIWRARFGQSWALIKRSAKNGNAAGAEVVRRGYAPQRYRPESPGIQRAVEIRRGVGDGETYQSVGKRFGISKQGVGKTVG